MDNKKNSSFLYKLLFAFARFNFLLFYRKVHVEGLQNIPFGKPLIFAANHQNALMDALAMLFSTNKEIFFLSRADIFKNRRVAKLLTFLKIMPVYRPRDGAHTLHLNSHVFEKTAQMLQSGIPLGIFPEGSHQEKKRLFPLKKGICRIAFEAAEKTDYTIDLTIIPIGLDYSNYQDRGSDLVINVGNPIAVKDYYELYRENSNKAITKLRDDISAAIIPLMIHVENLEEYTPIKGLAETIINAEAGNNTCGNAYAAFLEKQKIIQYLDNLSTQDPESFIKMKDANLLISKSRSHQGSKYLDHNNRRVNLMILFSILSIFIIPGLILNLVPYLSIKYQVKKIKDPQFKSSYNYVLSLLAYPIWHVILFIIILMSHGFVFATIIVALAAVSGIISLRVLYHIKHLLRRK